MKSGFIKIAALVLSLVTVLFSFASCSEKNGGNTENNNTEAAVKSTVVSSENNPTAVIKIKDMGEITIELYPDLAPNTVNNFISLSKSGFYNGLTVHRVVPGFVIQMGDPSGNGTGGPGYTIEGEFSDNGYKNNTLSHTRGVVSMARSQDYNSAGSQFFICLGDATHLDGQYAAFGKVISGMDVADKIADVQTDSSDKPVSDVVIESVTVDTKEASYSEPKTLAE